MNFDNLDDLLPDVDFSDVFETLNNTQSQSDCDRANLQGKFGDNQVEIVDNQYICNKCKIPLVYNLENYSCVKCNLISDLEYFEATTETKVYSEDTMLTVAGKEAYKYKRMMHSINTYEKTRNRTTEKQFNKINYNSETTKFPQHVINNAKDLFQKIQEYGHVLRARVRKGAMAACLYYECKRSGITKKQKDISELLDIPEKYVRSGEKILLDLHNKNFINIPVDICDGKNYIKNYFEMLLLDKHYLDFVNEVFERTNILQSPSIKIYNKCIAIIYLLINAKLSYKIKPKNIDKLNDNRIKPKVISNPVSVSNSINKNAQLNIYDLILNECKIPKLNYTKYYNFLIKNRSKFKDIFIKHCIPYPVKIKSSKKTLEFRYLNEMFINK